MEAHDNERNSLDLMLDRLYAQTDPAGDPALLAAVIAKLQQGRVPDDRKRGGADPWFDTISTGGSKLGPKTTGVTARLRVRMSYVPLSMAHLLNPTDAPLVSVDVAYARSDRHSLEYARLGVRCWVQGYSAEAVRTVELRSGTAVQTVNLLPTFFPDRIQSVRELTRATIHVVVDHLDGGTELHETTHVDLLPPTTAVLYGLDPETGERTNLTRHLVAWVTPNAPEVRKILRSAASMCKEGVITGYQAPPPTVEQQVEAVFHALADTGVTYVNSVVSFGGAPGEVLQRVRLPAESLGDKSANCIDATLLVASLLEAASLDPAVILVPGHAFAGWRTSPDGSWDYLEATMIGASNFASARNTGRSLAKAHEEKATTAGESSFFERLDVRALRKGGIYPMA